MNRDFILTLTIRDYQYAYCINDDWYFYRKMGLVSFSDWMFRPTGRKNVMPNHQGHLTVGHYLNRDDFIKVLGGEWNMFVAML